MSLFIGAGYSTVGLPRISDRLIHVARLLTGLEMRTHVDLFSGIGGFSLGLESVGFQTVLFCEYDKARQRDLRHHWPDVPIVADVNNIDAISGALANATGERCGEAGQHCDRCEERPAVRCESASSGAVADAGFAGQPTGGNSGWHSACGEMVNNGASNSGRSPFILTAGVPCQPASSAGQRKASADDRWLWPQTLCVVERLRPRWVVFENPLGIASLAEPAAIPGVDLQRLRSMPGRTICEILSGVDALGYELPTDRDGFPWIPVVPAAGIGAYHGRDRLFIIGRRRCRVMGDTAQQPKREQNNEAATEPHSGDSRRMPGGSVRSLSDWSDARIEQGADGIWRAVKPRLCLLASRVPGRVAKLRGYGNTVIPQIVAEIGKAIIESEGLTT